MKILLYAEPTTILNSPYPQSAVIRDHLYEWVAKNLINIPDVEIKMVVPELVYIQNNMFHHINNIELIEFKDSYLTEIFPDAVSIDDMCIKVFNNDLSKETYETFNRIIKNILPDFTPDIVIDFQIHNYLLKQAYPNAFHMLVENGIFSRPPFCRALRYEPVHFLNGFLNKYENEIRNYQITEAQKLEVQKFKRELIKLIDKYNPKKEILNKLKSKYKFLILCPIPPDNLYKETKYDDQYMYLLDILNNIPTDIGLIITLHDDCSSQLNEGIVKTLQQKYNNLIYFPVKNNSCVSQSLDFFKYCDAIINMHTMTGTQAMLWDLKIISTDKQYSQWFCDKKGLDNIEEFLAAPKQDNSNMIYWYFTHFAVFDYSMSKPNWYYNFFKSKYDNFKKNGITFELFEQIEDFSELTDYIIKTVNTFYIQNKKSPVRIKKHFSDIARIINFYKIITGIG